MLSTVYTCEPNLFIVYGDAEIRFDNTASGSAQIGERKVIDKVTNVHGKHFISYLSNAGECVVNGMVSSHLDDWTNVTVANKGGTSVVDYCTRNCTGIEYFKECYVTPFIDFLEEADLVGSVPSTGHLGGHEIVSDP